MSNQLWSARQIKNLQRWQDTEWVPHFTCCGYEGCERNKREDNGLLTPTPTGWVCPCGKYTQSWAREDMLDGNLPPDYRKILKANANATKRKFWIDTLINFVCITLMEVIIFIIFDTNRNIEATLVTIINIPISILAQILITLWKQGR